MVDIMVVGIMVNGTDVKDIIETRVFPLFGVSCTYSSLLTSSTTISSYGDATMVWATGVPITVCPANAYNTYEKFYEFGDLQKGDQDILLLPSQNVQVWDKVTLNSINYRVKDFKEYHMDGTFVVTVARLVELL